MLGWNEEIKKTFKSCGTNVFIGHHVLFARPELVELGNNVRIDPFTYIACGLKTGDNIHIGTHCAFVGQKTVILEEWNAVAFNSKLLTASEDGTGDFGPINDFWGHNKIFEDDIIFKKFSSVGTNVIIMPGTVLPEGTVFGANSFVKKNHQAGEYEIWLGNPPRKYSTRNKKEINAKRDEWAKQGWRNKKES